MHKRVNSFKEEARVPRDNVSRAQKSLRSQPAEKGDDWTSLPSRDGTIKLASPASDKSRATSSGVGVSSTQL